MSNLDQYLPLLHLSEEDFVVGVAVGMLDAFGTKAIEQARAQPEIPANDILYPMATTAIDLVKKICAERRSSREKH